MSSNKALSFSVLDLGYSNKTIARLLTHMNTCGSEAQFCWEIEFLYGFITTLRWMISHNAEGSGTGVVLTHGMLMGLAEYQPNGLIDRRGGESKHVTRQEQKYTGVFSFDN